MNKSLISSPGSEAFALSRVLVFHDGENCWVPNHADLRFAAVRDALAEIVADLVPGASEEAVKRVMKYSFFLSRDEMHPFHPHTNYWNDMDSLGCLLEAVGNKKGAVDTKMKMRLAALGEAGGGGGGGGGTTGEDCHGVVVLVIAGDKDFIPELTRLCDKGYYVILMHRNNITSTRVIEECCHVSYDCWEALLSRTHPSLSYSTKMVYVHIDR